MIVKATVPKQYAPLFDNSVSEIIEPSGRVSAKSTSNEIAAILLMLKSRDNNIWYARAEKSDIRTTIFSSMLATIQMMNLDDKFTNSLSPFQIVCKTTKAKCYFSGINGKTDDDMTATKGFTPQNRKLAMCILDEADEVKHPNHITAWESTAVRFLLPYGKMVYAHNPPMSRSHWAFKFFGDKIRNGAKRVYCTWLDIVSLLPKKTIEVIKRFRDSDPEYYKYWYLGEAINFRGLVYPQLKRDIHLVNIWQILRKEVDKSSKKEVKLSKQEYAVVKQEVMRKNASGKGQYPTDCTYTANNFVVYENYGLDNFKVIQKLDIENNRDKISLLLKEWKEK